MNLLEKIPFYNILESSGLCELDNFEEAIMVVQNFKKYQRDIIIIKNNLYNATKLYEEIKNHVDDNEVSLFGFDESFVVETIAASPELSAQRSETLLNSLTKEPKIIVTHALGLIRPIIARDKYQEKILNYHVGDEIDFQEINDYLVNNGYSKVSKVTMPFEYTIRGNVIDIYGFGFNYPIRIDTFDDEIESIKLFEVANQRSRLSIEEFKLYPATIYDYQESQNILDNIDNKTDNEAIIDELSVNNEINKDLFFSRYYNLASNKSSIISYLNDPLIIISSFNEFEYSISLMLQESYEYLIDLEKENKAISNYELFFEWDYLIDDYINIDKYRQNTAQISMNLFALERVRDNKLFLNDLRNYLKEKYEIYFFLSKTHHLKTIENLLNDNNINFDNVHFVKDNLSRGFVENDEKLVVYTDKELFYKQSRKQNFLNKYSNAVDIVNLAELKENDYIVHNHHGIGQYLGIVQLKVDSIEKDFLHIKYRNDEKLYIPINQFNLIKKYSSSDVETPKISILGGSDWKKTKAKVKNKIEDMMDELLELYATRKEKIGFSFSPDNEIQQEFENDFEYELTPDQAKAIEEVKADMESDEVMDRLICGDVGYGKTEVALRAILKAVISNKQVAFLCPTTILSRQHYMTLIERFEDYSINIVQLSRNTSSKMVKQIKEDLKNKKIDIVVGTHKILGKDIAFQDLGLLVVDEEQRFGVKDKEKIKQLKKNVDVLTLSATPIPRTLQMSLTGLRKMSLLQTPPINRVPIQTYVVEKNKYLIKEAIERELVRDGQVFYLYNKTANIDEVALRIEKMFDNVKVAVIHGKMPKDKVEQVMERFDDNEYNVLVCTTIIETGIDIPNANTIIIEDANKFGLAQLYQIKGRVGRSNRVGYAYLMYQKNKVITEDATKRLDAIKELTKLGSGYKIALRDLAIRGAGDILGKAQAGNIETVGYEMYLELLQEVIDQRNNVETREEEVVSINIKNTGYIPKEFTLDDDNKIKLYQKIYQVKELNEFTNLIEEFRDLYGKLPGSIMDLIEKRKFELLINNNSKYKIIDEAKKMIIQLQVNINDKKSIKKIFECVDLYSGLVAVEIKYQKVHLTINKFSSFLKTVNEVISDIDKII